MAQYFSNLTIDYVTFYVNIYALLISLVGIIVSTKKYGRLWKTRHLRKVWGIKDKDYVVVVCSELDEPSTRQNVEPREFIYNLKYGDVDAYFEVVITLLRLYPRIKLKIMSSGEVSSTKIDLAQHLILIGGPDYNMLTEKVIKKNITRYDYLSPYVEKQSTMFPNEIFIHDKVNSNEFFEEDDDKDFGYFERIKNPNNPNSNIILFGGCHTIGVTAAVKAISMADSEHGEIPKIVLDNAKLVSRSMKKNIEFSYIVSAERTGQTINTPIIGNSNINN